MAEYGGINYPEDMPSHVAVIMDGNGRWAKRRGMPRTFGHKAGVEAVRRLVRHCGDIGLPILTVYAFSTENFKRPQDEVGALMNLLCDFMARDVDTLVANGVRLRILGNLKAFPQRVAAQIDKALEKTSQGRKMLLNIALAYGARDEIMQAVRKVCAKVLAQGIKPEEIDSELFESCLYTASIPDPDLIIRTSGEERLSNFLLYQAAYSELYFTDVAWPDFTPEHFDAALAEYKSRVRRFGGI